MPTIYDVIEALPFDNHNFFVNGQQLGNLIKEKQVKTVIEVGSWLGGSTRFFAGHIPDDGYVIAVDHWQGSEEHQAGERAYNPKLSVLYHQFLSNCIHANVAHKIVPVRMSSLEASKAIKICPDLFYLDAAHDEESVYQDLSIWYPKLKDHSIVCGDDWSWETVRRAVERFAREQNLNIKAEDNFWVYEEN